MSGEILYDARKGGKITYLMVGDETMEADVCRNIVHIQLNPEETCVRFKQVNPDGTYTEWISSDAYFMVVEFPDRTAYIHSVES